MIRYRSFQSEGTPSKLFRKLRHGSAPTLTWNSKDRRQTSINCSSGQRKLLMAEIEFITKVSQVYPLKSVLCLYIGSAPGTHILVLARLFPEVHFMLWDPLPHQPELHHNANIRIENTLYETQKSHKLVLEHIKEKKRIKHVMFISDIRRRGEDIMNEASILGDTIMQQHWVLELQSVVVAYSLKFRLPYAYKSQQDYSYTDTLVPQSSTNNRFFLYLDGDLYFQLYAPIMSTETRLVYVSKTKPSWKPIFREYDPNTYQDEMYWFNIIGRALPAYTWGRGSALTQYNVLGYDAGYESTAEYCILSRYLKGRGLQRRPRDIIGIIDTVSSSMSGDNSRRHLCICSVGNHVAHMMSNKLWDSNQENYKKYMCQVRESIETQIEYFRRGKLLPHKRYGEQSKAAQSILLVLQGLIERYGMLPQAPQKY